ncbi:MAG: hypothetical protein KY396_00270 [Actinobacteria bacterium]|nr:hypothetical protein [Actinomycetota bacterium]
MTRAERAAANEAVFREVNERIKQITLAQESPRASALCECSDASCTATIDITLDEYDDTRRHATRFVLVAGHEDPTIERVVDRNDRYLVVEKTGGGADIARALDPRS